MQSNPSWSAQQAHLLTEEERLQQGHHRISAKGSLRLYSRDDVYPALRLQSLLRNAVLQGWRPSVPQHRGGQSALAEPKVDTIEQYSKVGSMDFHWFGFGAPQPSEGIATPPPVDDSVNSDSSSSSSSSESDAPMEEKPTLKKKQSTSKPRAQYSQICCGVTHFGVGHAMIPDDSAQESSLYWQELPWKSACGRRLSKTTQMMDASHSNQIQAFCNHPGCRRAWESMYKE